MTSKNWIYDPPPPPPKKATVENAKVYNSQRRGTGRDFVRGNVRGTANFRGRGNARANYPQRQQNRQPANIIQNSGYPQSQGYAAPGFQNPMLGYGAQNFTAGAGYNQGYNQPHWPTSAYQYPQPQFNPYNQQLPQIQVPLLQSQPQFLPPQYHSIPQQQLFPFPAPRPLPIYQSQPPKPNPQQNAYGYTLSSTAYSLPSHHSKPVPTNNPELSEEELRYALEQQLKKKTGPLPIQGTNIRLETVEDIMAWREQRKKKWLSKIAAADGPIRGRKRTKKVPIRKTGKRKQTEVEKEEESEESDVDTSSMSEDVDEGYLSEGEVFVPKKRSKKDVSNQDGPQVVVVADGNQQPSLTLTENFEVRAPEPLASKKNTTKKEKQQTKMNNVCHLWLQRKCHRGKNCKYLHEKKKPGNEPRPKTEEDDAGEENGKPKSLYVALLQSQMERENIVLLQVLLHLREHGLLDLN